MIPAKADVVLSVRGATMHFGPTQALAGVDLDLCRGEILALMGANGAGKSTLVNIMSGSVTADQCSMSLAGRPYRPSSPRQAADAGLITVHQATGAAGVPGLTVADALVLDRFADGRAPFFLSRRSVRRQAAEVAARAGFSLPFEADFADVGPAIRQLVGIARALAHEARVLILDEPTASLSPAESERLFAILEDLRGRGLSIVYISHRSADLTRLADRALVLRGGRVAGLFARPIDFAAVFAAMIGRSADSLPTAPHKSIGAVAFSMSGVRLLPSSTPIDLTLRNGEVAAITGPLGAGKSRLLNMIFGALRPHAGVMHLDGGAYQPRFPAEAIARGVALAGEDRHRSSFLPSDWPGGTVAGTISLPHLSRWFPHVLLIGGRDLRAARGAISKLAIAATGPHARLDSLSGGNQQKVVLARWQAERTRLLLLDEPFQGVDVGARAEIVAALRAGSDGAVLIATSDPEEALQAADRIYRMDRHALTPWPQGAADASR